MLDGDRLLKAKEVAEQLRIDTKTVYSWINSGRIAHLRTPTNYIRVRQSELDRFMASQVCGGRIPGAMPAGLGEQENP